MRYLGGKARIARHIVALIESRRVPGQLYVEPFVGGCNVLPWVSGDRWGNEINADLVELYRAVRDGWDPPTEVSRELYASLRNAPTSALRGFVGVAASYVGKWFGGNHERYRSSARQSARLRSPASSESTNTRPRTVAVNSCFLEA